LQKQKWSTKSCNNPAQGSKAPQKKNAAAKDCRGVRNRKGIYEKLLDDVNRFLDVVVRLVDVFESALLETLGEGIVFFLGDIAVGFVNEFQCPVETAAPVEGDS
jgi:hypothetical protein